MVIGFIYTVEVNSNFRTTVNSELQKLTTFTYVLIFILSFRHVSFCFKILYNTHAIDHLNRTSTGIDAVFPDFSNVLDNNKYIHETMTLNNPHMIEQHKNIE